METRPVQYSADTLSVPLNFSGYEEVSRIGLRLSLAGGTLVFFWLVEAAFTPVRETQIGQTDVSFAVPLAKYGDRLLLVFALETGLPCPPHVGLSTRWRFEARRDRPEKTHCS